MIPVTKTFLPPLEHYSNLLKKIWQGGWVTNNGPMSKELSSSLTKYLGVNNIELVSNGTIALQIAIKALNLKGEIITTPFSYVATTSSILWENCDPIFVDIENKTFCIDPDQIEEAITENTTAILATHVYGYPCNVLKIEKIAKKYGLKIIYDAAHAFGVKLNGKSVLLHGDIATLSFHATKLFHTIEGGALICRDPILANRISLMKKFGHFGEEEYLDLGINGKMSDLHAAMGLCVLPNVDNIINRRKLLSEIYDSFLDFQDLIRPTISREIEYNYAYYPVIFPSYEIMMGVRKTLIENKIQPRRYFYPSLNTLSYLSPRLKRSCPKSESYAHRVLCLPLYNDLNVSIIKKITEIINGELARIKKRFNMQSLSKT